MVDASPCKMTRPSSMYTAPSAYSSSSNRWVTHNAVVPLELATQFLTALTTPNYQKHANNLCSAFHQSFPWKQGTNNSYTYVLHMVG